MNGGVIIKINHEEIRWENDPYHCLYTKVNNPNERFIMILGDSFWMDSWDLKVKNRSIALPVRTDLISQQLRSGLEKLTVRSAIPLSQEVLFTSCKLGIPCARKMTVPNVMLLPLQSSFLHEQILLAHHSCGMNYVPHLCMVPLY